MTPADAHRAVALTIAGSDSSGGAGIVADLKTFEALGVWGTAAVTAVTAQNTRGVRASLVLPPWLVRAQIDAIASDVRVEAAKTGMLGSAEVVRAVADGVRTAGITRLVVDPIMVAKHGVEVLDRGGMVAAATELHQLGARVVALTGGHLPDRERSPDLIWTGDGPHWLEAGRVDAVHTHGTGCVLSAAITAELALGCDPVEACIRGKRFVTGAIQAGFRLGQGVGPVDPGWRTPS